MIMSRISSDLILFFLEMNKMKIAILGSSGQSGKFLTEQALADGHHVVALVRNPEKMAINHDNLEVT